MGFNCTFLLIDGRFKRPELTLNVQFEGPICTFRRQTHIDLSVNLFAATKKTPVASNERFQIPVLEALSGAGLDVRLVFGNVLRL